MTATAAAAPASSGVTPGRPSTTRVTILTGRRMTDLVLPAAAPIETYIDETVSVLAELHEDTPKDVLAGFDFAAQGVWAFARPGAPPMKFNESLDDAGVVDGSLLTLVSVSRTERYRPLVEDVIDAIAVLDESPEFDRTRIESLCRPGDSVRRAGGTIMSLVAWSRSGQDWWWAVALGVLGLGLLGGSTLATNRYQNIDMAESLLVAALPTLAGAAALAVPLPQGYDSLGAPQVAGAAAVVLLLTLATRGGPRKKSRAGVVLRGRVDRGDRGAIAFGYGWQYWVPAGAIAFGLIVVTNAAKLTVAVARIALPPIPAPGETVGSEELLDPVTTTRRRGIPDLAGDHRVGAGFCGATARTEPVGEAAADRLRDRGCTDPVDRGDSRCGAGAFLHSQHDRRRACGVDLRIPVAALRRAVVCLGVDGRGCRHPDWCDGEAVPVVSRACVAGARHVHGPRRSSR